MPKESTGAYRRQDEAPDGEFFSTPRFVQHIEDRAIAAVTQIYRKYLTPNCEALALQFTSGKMTEPQRSLYRTSGCAG